MNSLKQEQINLRPYPVAQKGNFRYSNTIKYIENLHTKLKKKKNQQ